MEPFTTLTALAVPMPEANVDTDIIVPARFLLITDKRGLGRFAFYERRYLPGGEPRPDFVLNDLRYAGARILVAGANFGCGSSREHAPWALADLGFRAIIAPSFGDIFARNCARNGIPAVRIADTAALLADAAAGLPLTVDLIERRVVRANGDAFAFALDADVREALLNGWDEVATIIGRHAAAITGYEARQQAAQPWLWSEG